MIKNEVSFGRNILAIQWDKDPAAGEYIISLMNPHSSSNEIKTLDNSYEMDRGIIPCTKYKIQVLSRYYNSTYSSTIMEIVTAKQGNDTYA